MTTNSLAPWFGSNRTLAQHVGHELNGCTWVGIGFAGSLAEIKHIRARTLLINDLHRGIINLAQVAAHPVLGPQLYRRLRRTPFHPDTLAQTQQNCLDDLPIQIPNLAAAYDYFVAVWLNRSTLAGTDREFHGQLSIRWTATGGDSAKRFRSATRAIIEWRRILERATFTVQDVFEFLAKCKDQPGIGIYLDPPFPGAGDRYRHKFDEKQQRRLAQVLVGYRHAKVVIRYYDHPLIRELYPETRWRWKFLAGRKQDNTTGPEVLIVNYLARPDPVS